MITLEKINESMALTLKNVRLSALKDAPSAFGSTYQDESKLSDEDWRRRASAMSGDGAIGYIALHGGRPCGTVRGCVDEENSRRAHVASMWVSPEHRQTGIASKLLEAVQRWAISLGGNELVLTVTSNNESAIALYVRRGFKATGRTEPYPNDSTLSELEFIKRLPS
jgi:ribosomal protein S18 acetylase RimI-like enzyme